MKQARNDIAACARYFEFYGGAADKIHGDTIPFLTGYQVMILREPRGVTGHIIPWNYPAQMFGRTLARFAGGGECRGDEAGGGGLPVGGAAGRTGCRGRLSAGRHQRRHRACEEAGAALTSHPDVDFISFTGSPEVGTLVQQAAAVHHVPCVAGTRWKIAADRLRDADQAKAAEVITNAIVQNAGQTCSRVAASWCSDRSTTRSWRRWPRASAS